jgi:hypothetical protein
VARAADITPLEAEATMAAVVGVVDPTAVAAVVEDITADNQE